MPIIQIRSTSEKQWATVPYPPTLRDVLGQFIRTALPIELLQYPPDYMGDITPEKWRETHAFLLNVDPTGEQAEVTFMGKSPEQMPLEQIMAELRAAAPEQKEPIGETAIINAENKTTFVSVILPVGGVQAAAIGGVMLHADTSEIDMLGGLFPGVPIQPAEGA